MASRITIQLVGSTSDKEDIRLNDFIEQLRGVKKSLAENERLLSGTGENILDYKIVDLRHSSPSTVVLEPVFINHLDGISNYSADYAPKVFEYFSDELRSIRRDGKLKREPEIDRLESYQHLGYHPEGLIQKIKIVVDRKPVTIDRTFREKLEKIIGPDEIVEGSISGRLEAINLHKTNKFFLYPVVGPKKVLGIFPNRLKRSVKDAIESFVTIRGKLRYKSWSPFPHGVFAEFIDVHPPDESLPRLSEMRGMYSNLTGDLSSVEFVERLRDEWQQ